MRLYLVRHAQSEANVRGALDTALPGPPLTELGVQQARDLAGRLGEERIVAVYASRAIRARQTAEAVAAARALEVQVVDGVQEIAAGDLEGRTDRPSIDTYLGVLGPWARGELAVQMPGGETGAQVRRRFRDAVTEIGDKHRQAHPDGTVALVCHGALMRLGSEWLADNVRPEIADKELLPNTAVIELESTTTGGWHCVSWSGLVM